MISRASCWAHQYKNTISDTDCSVSAAFGVATSLAVKMFEITLPFVLCISLLTYQQKMHISLLPAAHSQEEQPSFSISRNKTSNFSLETVWTLSGKDSSVSKLEEDTVVNKVEFIVKVTEGSLDYYMAVEPIAKYGKKMVFLTTDKHGAARFIPNPRVTGLKEEDELLDISKPFFIRYEHNGSSYLLHCSRKPDGTADLFVQKLRSRPPRGSELLYAVKEH